LHSGGGAESGGKGNISTRFRTSLLSRRSRSSAVELQLAGHGQRQSGQQLLAAGRLWPEFDHVCLWSAVCRHWRRQSVQHDWTRQCRLDALDNRPQQLQ